MATQIKLRRDSAANWALEDPVLAEGEPGFDLTNNILKIGDGSSTWTGLASIYDLGTNIVPAADNTYDLGSPTNQWRHVYTAGGSIYLDNIKLTNVNGKFVATKVVNPGEENEAEDPEDSDATSDISGGSTGNFTFKADRITNDWGDVSIEVGGDSPIENVVVDDVDELVPPGGVWRMFFLDTDYLNLGTIVEVGDTVTTSWGTPITAAITNIVQDISTGKWALHFDQDITAEFTAGDTVTFTQGLEVLLFSTSNTWTFGQDGSLQIPGGITGNNDINITIDNDDSSTYTWNFDRTGNLTAPGDITTGLDGPGGRFIQDCADGTTSMRWINVNQGDDTTQLIRAYTGDPKLNTEVERAQIKLNWDQTEDKSGLTIRTFDQSNPNNEVDHDWLFKGDGVLQLPVGGDIVDSNGDSVLGGGSGVDNNIWVQTFETATPATDVPQVATGVEYDSDGNIIALFSHVNPVTDSTYYSVAKYTTTGTRIWTTRFADDFNTDGWGLAVDNAGGFVYIAGDTNADGGEDNATLTKISGVTGLVEWSKIYDFGFSSFSSVVDVTSDGDPVMVGFASNGDDRYVATTKVDAADGSVIWSRALDGQNDEEAYGMAVGPSGEVVAVGYMESFGVQDAAETLSVDPVSDPQWTTSGSISADGVTADFTFTDGIPTFTNVVDTVGVRTADDVIVTVLGSTIGGVNGVDDMIVKVATVAANDTDNRMLVVKYAANGTIAWQKAIQFDADFDCSGADADIDSQGNIYVCGQYNADNVGPIGQLMSIVKFNSSGVKQWSRRVVGNCGQWSSSIVVGADDHLYLSATTFSGTDPADLDIHLVLAKYEFDGTVAWQRLLDYTAGYSFGTNFFGSDIGGSNLAVKQDYVAVSLGFGSQIFEGPGSVNAAVAQISATGDIFTVGSWDFKAASFIGTVNSTASDILVVDAGKTDYDNIANISTTAVTLTEDSSNFLIGTLYTAPGGDNSLINGAYTVTLENTGTVTLPAGGTITEGYVTSNPTIQLTPASPDVASQKLVIKGGGSYSYTDNGIEINYNNNTGIVGDTLTFTIYSTTYSGQTLYWWINPEGAGIGDTESGTVTITDNTGQINILIDSDDYEFTLRVSPEDHNYDPASLGVESGLINADAPTFDADHHLHLTTGDLAETSIFLGTDDHNVRTTVNGDVEINTFLYPSGGGGGKWTFDTNGNLTIPGDIRSEGNINIDINLSDSTLRRWQFGEDGLLTFPDTTVQTTAYPGVLVPANGDNVSGVANLVFYAGTDWYNTSKVGINPANGFLTIAGTGGAGGIILPNSGVIDVGSQFGTTLGLTRKIYSEYLGGYGIPNPTYSELVTALAGWTPDTIETVHPVAWSGIPEQTWELTGYFKAPAAGTYTFSSAPDDYCFIVVDGDINPTPEMNAPAVIVLTQGQIVSYRVLYANVAGSGTLTLSWRNTTSQISDTANFTGLLCTTLGTTVDITVNNNKTWEFGENGSTTLPIVPWNYVETTFTSVLVTYGETRLTFTVQPDNSITNMSVAVGAGGYGPDSVNLSIPGTTFPGGTSPANNIVFNVQTFESAGPVYSTTTASIVTYVSGTLPQKYDNIASTGSVGIGAGSNHWTFGEDGSLTLPIGVSIDSSVSALYPKIIADSGKLFSIQGQGSTGSAALAWTVNPDAAGQYAAVAVTKVGGDNLAKVVLQAQSDSGDAATIKLWKFDETGALTIPGDIRSEGAINIDINLTDSTLRRWRFGEDGDLTFPDATVQTTAHIQGEQIFTVDTGATAYAPTAVDFNLLFVTAAVGYSETDPISVTLPNGVPGQRLVIFNGYNLATLTVNPGPFGRDISGGVIAEFIYSGFDGLWMPLYGTNSPT